MTLSNLQLIEEYQLPRTKFTEFLKIHNLQSCLDKGLSEEVTKSLNCKYYDLTEFNETRYTYITDGLITINHINLQSSFKNYNLLKAHLDSINIKFDLIAITEAGVNNLDRCANIFKEYNFYYHGSLNNNTGGVVIYTKDLYIMSTKDMT